MYADLPYSGFQCVHTHINNSVSQKNKSTGNLFVAPLNLPFWKSIQYIA